MRDEIKSAPELEDLCEAQREELVQAMYNRDGPPFSPKQTPSPFPVLGSWVRTMRDAVGNQERWERRRAPTQYPSTVQPKQPPFPFASRSVRRALLMPQVHPRVTLSLRQEQLIKSRLWITAGEQGV